jgi:hypothetical protein
VKTRPLAEMDADKKLVVPHTSKNISTEVTLMLRIILVHRSYLSDQMAITIVEQLCIKVGPLLGPLESEIVAFCRQSTEPVVVTF